MSTNNLILRNVKIQSYYFQIGGMMTDTSTTPGAKTLYRSRENKALAGVCGGIGEYFNIDPTIVRILWVLFSFFYLIGVIVYIILAVVIPQNPHYGMHVDQDGRSQMEFGDGKTGSRVPSGTDGLSTSHGTSICPYCDGQIQTGDVTCVNCGASL